MISKNDFDYIYSEVSDAIKETFAEAYNESNKTNDFICFLANGNYLRIYENTRWNPNIVDYSLDIIRDKNRLEYLRNFLNDKYNFKENRTFDTNDSITNELMIYTHIWESKPFLKTLKRLFGLIDTGRYLWDVEVPDYSKHKFIRDIKESFNGKNMRLGKIIGKGYNSSLRNAFAHSEYTFEYKENTIKCLNYKGERWEIDSISFKDWTKIFCYSFILSFELHNYKQLLRSKIEEFYKKNEFEIDLPQKNKALAKEIIVYNSEQDKFRFKS